MWRAVARGNAMTDAPLESSSPLPLPPTPPPTPPLYRSPARQEIIVQTNTFLSFPEGQSARSRANKIIAAAPVKRATGRNIANIRRRRRRRRVASRRHFPRAPAFRSRHVVRPPFVTKFRVPSPRQTVRDRGRARGPRRAPPELGFLPCPV